MLRPWSYFVGLVTGNTQMQPHLEIRRRGPHFFTYSLGVGQAADHHSEDALDSLEGCLTDAGDSLGHYFPAVSVSLNGMLLGSYEVERMLRNPRGLALELMGKAVDADRKAA